jgi:hypothetical protein
MVQFGRGLAKVVAIGERDRQLNHLPGRSQGKEKMREEINIPGMPKCLKRECKMRNARERRDVDRNAMGSLP